ncbi:hypothetical protein BASA81_002188 [Batrachochytrium salamandrivorans]|nr:hypothetical protein BASA81_002188 [Batrachochytrium salamandrivorans]
MLFCAFVALMFLAGLGQATTTGDEDTATGFELKGLPYTFDALEPAIDAQTMELHWGRHHRAYTDNMNTALATIASSSEVSSKLRGSATNALKTKNLKKLEETIRLAVQEEPLAPILVRPVLKSLRNNGGGYLNHNQYWENLSPSSDKATTMAGSTDLENELIKTFGTLENFENVFVQQGLAVFGSGWVWLAYHTKSNQLQIASSPNQDRLEEGLQVIVACDVWEHAYYLKRQNVRVEYLKAFFTVLDWKQANARFVQAKSSALN